MTHLYGTIFPAGLGTSMVLPDMDFETYSEAGHVWDEASKKWFAPKGSTKKGLTTVGAAVYAEHPSTEVLSLKYDLKDGRGPRHWVPGMPAPADLFAYLAAGYPIEAWNVGFERWIWEKVCVPRYGWPRIPFWQYRCAMAKARAFALPGKLAAAADVLNLQNKKDPDGDRLLKKFSMPRNPTAKDKRRRITPAEDHAEYLRTFDPTKPGPPASDATRLYEYNEGDILAEAEASSRCPDLRGEEFDFWMMDQAINFRGVQVDTASVQNCIAIIDNAHEHYNRRLYELTNGEVARASEIAKLQSWLARYSIYLPSMDEEAIDAALERADLPAWARQALEIRQAVGSAAVKKVYAMNLQATIAGRLHDLFTYYGARTGRTTGNGPQPTNLPKGGPEVRRCGCGKHFGAHHKTACPWCGMPLPPTMKAIEWNAAAAEDALQVIASRSFELVEHFFGNAMAAVSGCLRGLFTSAPGHDLICSDYSAIEAVVLAVIAGCRWRIDVFRTHGKIYEASAAMMAKLPIDEVINYKKIHGHHHPLRDKGKRAELACGYGGWVGAWIAFGADKYMTEDEMKEATIAWRKASPEIPEFWGGQWRKIHVGWIPELYGVEGMFLSAILSPGTVFEFRGFQFLYRDDVLYLRLLSGRYLHYHRPRLADEDRFGRRQSSISYEGWNTNPKNGPVGWIRIATHGGRLTENIVQATARDIQWHGMLNLERAGYPIVLHVYDEDVAEVPEGFGSIEELERIMSAMPSWAADWPVRATGGWRGKRYRKE